MKLLSFILSLYVFSLVTEPILGTIDLIPGSMCCQDFCANDKEQEQHSDQNEDGCNELCNPFLSCHCGFGFTASLIYIPLKTFSPFTEENREYQQSVSLQYFHSVWHPPKA